MVGSGIRDPGSWKNLFRIPDPGGKKVPDPGSRIRIRNTGRQRGKKSHFQRGGKDVVFGPKYRHLKDTDRSIPMFVVQRCGWEWGHKSLRNLSLYVTTHYVISETLINTENSDFRIDRKQIYPRYLRVPVITVLHFIHQVFTFQLLKDLKSLC